ncbi:ABC transporter permease [Legionella sp. km772]|uniref:ABC transporter permease n=1 Tax=Legionella sp. km772 TaxID=2498111 RepID=UPI000F8D015F|nr:FtsX-like permease family protein [Legionella sp. km772]RUR10695.1 FtsX-like permease family protein [Legionella sp. km772]
MLNFSMLSKSLIREWRSGELTLLFMALLIAVACISAMNNFTDMAKRELEQGAAQVLGADALVKSNKPIPASWKEKADALRITHNTAVLFQSMVEGQNHLQLAQIKAISTPYPLQGSLKIAKQLNEVAGVTRTNAPEAGTVWLSPRFFPLLSTDIGKTINIGSAHFRITGVIREEPGQTGDWFSIAPRLIMNAADVEKTKTIQLGSIVTYTWLLKGSKEQLEQLHDFVNKGLSPQQQWRDSQNNILTLSTTIERSLNYLYFAILMSLILAGVAISMASLRYCQRHLKQVALLRCFGASQNLILQLYLGNLALVGLVSCVLGALIGYGLQPLLIKWLGGLLPHAKQQFTLGPFFLSVTTGFILLFCFSTGSIWKLRKVSAISLFRQQHLVWGNSTYITYLLALLLLGGLAYYYTFSLKLTLIVMLGSVAFIGLALSGLWLLFGSLTQFKIRIPLNWRFGFTNIARNMEDSALQTIGIGLALTTILSLILLKNHLINDWRQQLPAQTPNYFIFNIEPEQETALKNYLELNQVKTAAFYPIWRGRLTDINNRSVNSLFGEQVKNINALQRELNLSWSTNLPEGNEVSKGSWHVPDANEAWVSVEQGVAAQLGLHLGDNLRFHIGDRVLNIKVSSLRQVDWTSFKPNFFMLFKPGLLDDIPHTVLTSFYLPPEKQSVLIEINKQFPNVSIIDIAQTINTVQAVVASAANALTLISSFALLVGLIIVTLAILSLSETKTQETQVLKILGMTRRTLLWIRSSEAFLIGLYSGLLAAVMAILINMIIAAAILNSPYVIPWLVFITVPLSTAVLVVALTLVIQQRQYQRKLRS